MKPEHNLLSYPHSAELPAAESDLIAQIMAPANRADPYRLYDLVRRRTVWRDAEGGYYVGRYEDVANLMCDPRLSANPVNSARGGAALSFLNMDPPEHDRLRRAAMRHFGPPDHACRVSSMTATLEATMETLIDRLSGRTEIDIVTEISHRFPGIVIADLLGVPREDEPRFSAWAEAIAQATDRAPGQRSEGAERAFQALAGYLFGLIAKRRRNPADDMLSLLVREDSLRPDEIVQIAALLLLAGHETTVNLISNGVLTLLRHPEALSRLRDEPELAPPLVEEILRYEPPVHLTFRGTLSEVEVGDSVIPAGSAVQLMLGCANRDPARFAEANRFIPDRRDNHHLGFGGGIHSCFGAPLARLEGQIALRSLARRLDTPRLLHDPPPYRFNPTLRGPSVLALSVVRVLS